ncbi:MAG: glycosyl transferase family 2 [Clostridia bacterium]|nr:glycosyl transferase family 2 [Clostridia bacterium]
MIITVYAISKNEEKFVSRWAESMREADHVVVLDTGSSDDTVNALIKEGVKVECASINPWRFDVARNESLKLVPDETDVCVCTDLDEIFEKGWRKKLEKSWVEGATQGRYKYVWSHEGKREGVQFLGEKIHVKQGFSWEKPVHEVLRYDGEKPQKQVMLEGVVLHHYPDESKSRGSYLALLELAVAENPKCDRSMHYLGREYMFRGEYQKAITTLLRHLSLPTATWSDERSASMRYIARCYVALDKRAEAEKWFLRAVAQTPDLREGYVEYAQFLFAKKDYHGVLFLLKKALEITKRPLTYVSDPLSWGALPYDLMALASYYVKDYESAVEYGEKAVRLDDEPRLKNNLEFYKSSILLT